MPEEKKIAMAKVDELPDGAGLKWTFSDGTVREIKVSDIPEALVSKFTLHGIEQKFRDSYAGAKGDSAAAIGLFDKVADTIFVDQSWTAKREGGPREEPIDILVEAVVLATSKPEAEVRPKVEAMDKATRAKLRTVPAVAKALVDVREAKKPKAATLESLGL